MEDGLKKITEQLEGLKTDALSKIKEVGEANSKSADELTAKMAETEVQFNEKIADIEKRMQERNLPGVGEEKQKFSFQNLFTALRWGTWENAGFEKEVIDEYAKTPAIALQRAATATDGTAGGVFVPTVVSDELIPLALAMMPTADLGVDQMPGLIGDLSIPKSTGRPTAFWLGENESITESDSAFGEIKLSPKRLGAFSKVSNQLMLQAPGVAEKAIRQNLSEAMALALEQAIIRGTGSVHQPRGVLNTPGLTTAITVDANGGRFTVDNAARMEKDIDVVNMLKNTANLGHLMRPEVISGMKRERIAQFSGDTAGQYIFAPPMLSNAQLESMVGYKIRTTTLLLGTETQGTSSTSSTTIFGDWAQVILAMWAALQLKVSDTAGNASGSAFLQDQMWLVAQQSVDVQVKDATGLMTAVGADTSEANW